MAADPDRIHMINGASGERVTNAEMLSSAVSVCRELTSRRLQGRVLLVVMRNHQHLLALYYGALFAGAVPMLLEPLSTTRELIHFMRVSSPSLMFCDADRRDVVAAAVDGYGASGSATDDVLSHEHIITHDEVIRIATTNADNIEKFEPVHVDPESVALLLPTSGSTGLAKAAEIQHSALLAHLPSLWVYHEQFPTPVDRVMFMSTAQWMTFSNLLTTCPVFGITVIISPDKEIPTILRIMETHKPTWALLVPGTAAMMSEVGRAEQFASLRTLVTTGAALPAGALPRLRRLAPRAHILNSYGMTETQGFLAIAHHTEPDGAIGKIFNIFDYKLVGEEGREVARGEKGELYVKSACVIKRYRNNPEAYLEGAAPQGWWRTGDLLVEDAHIPTCLHFAERKKFWFKYLNHQISPEELEAVVSSVPGVREVVVTDSARGAAAAVVLLPRAATTRDDIHAVVNREVPDYKQLRGGIAFVTTLPRTHSGKLHRAECTRYVSQLIEEGQCK